MQERSRRTREQVLDSAAAEFYQRGYGDATMQAVATRIGMTKGALYAHFGSKERLAAALVNQFVATWTELGSPGRAPGASAASVLHHTITALAQELCDDVRMRAAVRLLTDGSTMPADSSAALAQIRWDLTRLIRQAQDEGAIVSCYPSEAITRLLLAFFWGTARSPHDPACHVHQDVESDCGMLLGLLRADRRGTLDEARALP
jgi:AcrR family transcriptional regulator